MWEDEMMRLDVRRWDDEMRCETMRTKWRDVRDYARLADVLLDNRNDVPLFIRQVHVNIITTLEYEKIL